VDLTRATNIQLAHIYTAMIEEMDKRDV